MTNVLRIQRNDVDAHRVVLQLEGHIAAEWADLLERECLILIRSGLGVVLDLSAVVFIGRSGLESLGRLGLDGVGVIGCSPLIADMLEEEGIELDQNVGDTNDGTVPGNHETS